MKFHPITLDGRYVRLEPISQSHHDEVCEAISDGELWKIFTTMVPKVEHVEKFITMAQKANETGDGLTFATVDKISGKIAGSTRFMNTNLCYKRTEIGFTFLSRSFQKTVANTEAKLLMLSHAFETHDLNRVEFITDFLNEKSRRAILRLGAKEEGLLRNHIVMPDGRVRDSVVYSIINSEWPNVKENLLGKIKS
ncbi:MAG: GNAT family protein [Parasphingorhabdus sp.]